MNADTIEDYKSAPQIIRLSGLVQHYPWGGRKFIPELINQENADDLPFAELWMGAHASGSATAEIGNFKIALDRLIALAGQVILGPKVMADFDGKLPYLFKILDAREMLSIQVHPSKMEAEMGFLQEESQNMPLTSPRRNYRDKNHKPEIHVALSDFWMLHGFRPVDEIKCLLEETPEFHILEFSFINQNIEHLYRHVMEMPPEEVDAILAPLIKRLIKAYENGQLEKDKPEYWVVKAARQSPLVQGHYDRGLFSLYFLNLLHLKPGLGTFQAAGVPHAYLEGKNVELMADSDNVLRGGLTQKHIDVPELLSIISYESNKPTVLCGNKISETERAYRTQIADFELACIKTANESCYRSPKHHGPDTLIVIKGEGQIDEGGKLITFRRGDIFLVPHDVQYLIRSEEQATIYKATVPFRDTQHEF